MEAAYNEISSVLESFLNVREKALSLQYEALEKYEFTMNGIDNLIPDEIKVNRHADHNLLRHLGTGSQNAIHHSIENNNINNNVSEAEETQYSDDYDESFEDGEETANPLPHELSVIIGEATSSAKLKTPSFKQKAKIRSSVFEYVSTSTKKEKELESKIEKLRADGSDFRKIDEACENLYHTQISNADSLRKAIIGYKPIQGIKAWNQDADYAKLMKLFEDAVITKKMKKKSKMKSTGISKKKK